MNDVYIIGAGQIPVQKKSTESIRVLGARAVRNALADVELDSVPALYVGNMMSGILSNQQQLSAIVANEAGLKGIEALTVEAACGSGGGSAHVGCMAVASGMHDVVIAAGVERMTHADFQTTTCALATASDWETEGCNKETFVSLNARLMQEYMNRYGVDSSVFAPFAIVAHKNAWGNENALFHKEVTREVYENSKLINGPLRLYDASPICDGAAAIVLANADVARKRLAAGHPVVRIAASTVAIDAVGLDDRAELLVPQGVIDGCARAYAQASLGPEDIDIFELHDAYTIMSILSLEGAGFAAPGEGWRHGAEGRIELTGDLPIATMGGLKSRGHPVGATGIYQLAESWLQLSGRAGKNQVESARTALTQNVGGTAATVVTHILQRV